jgi:hypothetical protein
LESNSLKFQRPSADKEFMDIKTLIKTAFPTPFGWVIQSQQDVDLEATLAFQGQLISLAQICGPVVPTSEPLFRERVNVEAGVLVPMRRSQEQPRA